MNSALKDNIEVVLIINDSTTAKLNVNLSNVSNELITQICDDISSQYYIDERTKAKLYTYLCKEILRLQTQKETLSKRELKRDEFFNKLYYSSMKKTKEKEAYNQKLRQDQIEKELIEYSFTPNINIISTEQLVNKNYKQIGDKLYYQSKVIRRKKRRKEEDTNNNANTLKDNKRTSSFKGKIFKTINTRTCDLNQKTQETVSYIKKSKTDERITSTDYRASTKTTNTNTNRNIKRKILVGSYDQNALITTENNNIDLKQNHSDLFSSKTQSSSKRIQMHKNRARYNDNYSFKPMISINSQKIISNKRGNSNENTLNRLSESKTIKPFFTALRNLHSTNHLATKQKRASKRSINTEHIDTAMSTNPRSHSFPNKRMKSGSMKQENPMTGSLKSIILENNIGRQQYYNNQMSNTKKYILNQLKHIYEILISNSNNSTIDVNCLTENGIPEHIRDIVIIPACFILNEKSLEFNFHNFFLITSEILKKYLITVN